MSYKFPSDLVSVGKPLAFQPKTSLKEKLWNPGSYQRSVHLDITHWKRTQNLRIL